MFVLCSQLASLPRAVLHAWQLGWSAHASACAGRSDGECVGGRVSTPGVVAAVFTLTCNRAAYLKRMLAGLLDVHSSSYDNQ